MSRKSRLVPISGYILSRRQRAMIRRRVTLSPSQVLSPLYLSHIQRAVAVFCDDTNRNFSCLQSSPKIGMLEIAVRPELRMKEDMRLLYETHDNYDIKVKVGKRDFLCHKAVLIGKSEYFRKRLTAEPNADQLVIDKTVVESSDILEITQNEKNDKSKIDPLFELKESSRKLQLYWFHKWLTRDAVRVISGREEVKDPSIPPTLSFDRKSIDQMI